MSEHVEETPMVEEPALLAVEPAPDQQLTSEAPVIPPMDPAVVSKSRATKGNKSVNPVATYSLRSGVQLPAPTGCAFQKTQHVREREHCSDQDDRNPKEGGNVVEGLYTGSGKGVGKVKGKGRSRARLHPPRATSSSSQEEI